jgi:hypothetical protein
LSFIIRLGLHAIANSQVNMQSRIRNLIAVF